MPKEYLRQTNFNGGEMDPRMHGRRDVKTYYAMLGLAENVFISPLGPITRRWGTFFVDYVRRQLQPVEVLVGYIVTANGGTEADLLSADGTLFMTEQDMGADDHLLFTIDFGAPVQVSLVDLIDYRVQPAEATPAEPPPFEYPYPTPQPGDIPIYDPGEIVFDP